MKSPAILSILIPAFNEERTIGELLERVIRARIDPEKLTKQIIVIDDGSQDKTAEIVNAFIGRFPKSSQLSIDLIKKKNGGKGSAIRAGIAKATGDIIIVQDADLEYDPRDYAGLVEPILRGRTRVVYGSRYYTREQRQECWIIHKKKNNKRWSYLSFVVGGRLMTWATNVLYWTHLTDEPTCYKVFEAKLLKSLHLTSEGFEFCPEVTAKIAKRKIRIVEIPIAFYPRTTEEGKKIKWRDGFVGVWTLIKYKFVG